MTRRKLLAFSGLGVLLLAAVLVVVLAPQKPESTFPLSKKNIEAACDAQGLRWKLREPQSFKDGELLYMAYKESYEPTDRAILLHKKIDGIHY